ncbi:MAG TPA: RagB/SusD family nutrient uptake outer membrane protein [Chitinophaga sp.]
MKKVQLTGVKIIMGLVVAPLLLSSCKKLIDIPANPPSAITQVQEFADSATAMTAVAGIYSYVPNSMQGFPYNDAFLTICTALSADELSSTSSNSIDFREFYSYGLTPVNSNIATLWSKAYQRLYSVNAILEGVAGSEGLSAAFKRQITGEMKTVRAFYYFNLVNLYGGVPLVTTTDYRQSAHIARASADTIYRQAIADLRDAAGNLSADYPSGERTRPNLYTALTLLAKIHLYQAQWQDAYNEADSVIRSAIYQLEPELNNVFTEGSREAIWQLPSASSYQVTSEAFQFVPYSTGITPNYLLSPFLLNAFKPGDQRRQKWVGTTVANTGGTSQTFYYPYKYKNKLPTDLPVEDYMICRLGEVYLIRAEAAARLGQPDEALADLNAIRNRAGLENSNAQGQAAILDAIMQERQVELFTEWGNRWFDLKRTGTAGAVLSSEKAGWHDNAVLYPIPQGQLLLDDRLQQNPGY